MFDQFKVGDLIEISAPRNNFGPHEGIEPSVLIAGGIGVTPMICLIDQLARTGRHWRLFYSVRRRVEAAFLNQLANYGKQVQLHIDEDHAGELLDLKGILAAASADSHLYCCGPAPMLDSFEQLTADRPASQVHIERFSAKSEPLKPGGFFC